MADDVQSKGGDEKGERQERKSSIKRIKLTMNDPRSCRVKE